MNWRAMATIQNKKGSTSTLAAGSPSERQRAIREEAYRDALTNLRLEGLEMDEEAKRIFQRHIAGEVSFEGPRLARGKGASIARTRDHPNCGRLVESIKLLLYGQQKTYNRIATARPRTR